MLGFLIGVAIVIAGAYAYYLWKDRKKKPSKRLYKEKTIDLTMYGEPEKALPYSFATKKLIDLQAQMIKHFLGEIQLADVDRVRYMAMIEVLKQVINDAQS